MIKSILKRVLPVLLAVLMLFSVMPMQAFASETAEQSAGGPEVNDYQTFVFYVTLLEELADIYIGENPGIDPLNLVIKYIRTGVDRYNSGSWEIMAGKEDPNFAAFVKQMEDALNDTAESEEQKIYVSALKNVNNFILPNGDKADLGHVFGTMDITYHNNGGENHADVGGWAGDLVDLLDLADEKGVSGSLEEMVADISENYLGVDYSPSPGFSLADIQGDLDAYYIMKTLYATEYQNGKLAEILTGYFTEDLSDADRADYFLKNRLDTTGTRSQIREVVYKAYTGNKVISTLEGTREFDTNDLVNLRKASCYAFADYLCELAGDYVDSVTNPYLSVFSNETSILAPGITQEIKQATTADNKQVVYYLATADITRNDVDVYANYANNDPGLGWETSRVEDQVKAAQEKYGNPESEHYIENYNVIASTNGAGYNMETGEPSGLLVMNGVEHHPINSDGFFGILKDGTAVIGSTNDYNTKYKGQVKEGIARFGYTLVQNGKIVVNEPNYFGNRASRTAVGITKTGKVVLMVIDGRQEPFSAGASMIEIAQIMLDAGCYQAVNLDGGGSSTYVAKQVGDEEVSLVNKPSDGYARSVSASLMMVSTAPSSTKFDHAVIESDYNYLTKGSSIKLNPIGVSATGNSVDLPEGTSWAVSDERWATISEDGTFTALRNGSVEVYLMLGEDIIGTKTIDIVIPDNIYYKKSVIDAVYGANLELPVVVLHKNKPVAFNSNDIAFTLSSQSAGEINGITFVGSEASGIKVLTINAALTAQSQISADITINLYNQGEVTFDFEQATGGDRQLAWQRLVSNSETDDDISYTIVNTDENMVTSYIVAMDMTTIPIPEVLNDLLYMLPGADAEGACAWAFLCQLAQRISSLSRVTATLKFDPNFDVDYSELKLINEYFDLYDVSFDEATNTLTVTLNWIKQTQAIDQATANPICIVNGIKLTPKADADWGSKNTIKAVNTGTISYQIYMRASALYSFAQKPENQETYGLYAYANPDDESDKGGYFGETYKEFYDTYNLIGALKNGWVNEEGGMAYYVDGEKLTGIQEVEGYYYDFGENGINDNQTTYTGLLYDEAEGVYRYSKLGVITTGWNMIDGEWYYFHNSTKAAVVGQKKMYGVCYTFEETGRLTSGVWANTLKGVRYYYGPSYYYELWQQIDGEWYYFKNSYVVKGYQLVGTVGNRKLKRWHDFGDDGACRGYVKDGFNEIDGGLYHIEDGVHKVGLHKIDGDYYFFTYNGPAIKNKSYYAWETHCDLKCDTYYFDENGKMANGITKTPDGYYRYVNGKVDWKNAGLYKIDGDYYFIDTKGKCVTGSKYAWATYCDLPCATYYFCEDGKMANGVVETPDGYYCYFNGKVDWTKAGLHKFGDDYYFIDTKGKCATGSKDCWATFCDLPIGTYYFCEDGKMANGVVETPNGYYCYFKGKIDWKKAGLHKFGDDYYFVDTKGKCITGTKDCWATFCDLPTGTYYFCEDGKMANGVVETPNGYYCYFNGKIDWKKAGLHKFGNDYYFVDTKGKCITGVKDCWATFCDLPCSTYEFGADGKMLHGFVEKDGVKVFYAYGKTGGNNAGLTKVGDDYYFVNTKGVCVTGKYYAWATNCDLPIGNYEFGEDGKMLNGFVTKGDDIYYYVNGKIGKVGINYIDGYYYFVRTDGKIVRNQSFEVWEGNGLLIEITYKFNELGQIIG